MPPQIRTQGGVPERTRPTSDKALKDLQFSRRRVRPLYVILDAGFFEEKGPLG
jgi:hypothetical protein